MGFGGISLWQLLIILLIVILLFGTKKLKGMGSDLGGALKGFKKAMKEEDEAKESEGVKLSQHDESSPISDVKQADESLSNAAKDHKNT